MGFVIFARFGRRRCYVTWVEDVRTPTALGGGVHQSSSSCIMKRGRVDHMCDREFLQPKRRFSNFNLSNSSTPTISRDIITSLLSISPLRQLRNNFRHPLHHRITHLIYASGYRVTVFSPKQMHVRGIPSTHIA
mgnify:FL=1